MHVARKIGMTVATVLLSLTVLFGIIFGSLQANFNNGEQLKLWLVESEVYGGVRATLLEQLNKEEVSENETIPREVLKRALANAITTKVLQQVSEGAIDGTHTWLSGETKKPQFAVKLQDAKENFASTIIARAEKRLQSLPPCVVAGQAITDNPFTINCRPPGVLLTMLKKEFRARINKDNKILPATFTADTQFGEDEQKPTEKAKAWYEHAKEAPVWYQRTMIAQWWFLLAGVLLIAAIVFMARNKRFGAKTAAITVATSSLTLAVSAGVLLFFMNRFDTTTITTETSLQEPVTALIQHASRAITRWQIVASLVIFGLSVGVVIALHLTRPQPNTTKSTKQKS